MVLKVLNPCSLTAVRVHHAGGEAPVQTTANCWAWKTILQPESSLTYWEIRGLRLLSFFNRWLHNDITVVAPSCYTYKQIFKYTPRRYAQYMQCRWKVTCHLFTVCVGVVWCYGSRYLPDGSRLNRRWPGCALSFSIKWAYLLNVRVKLSDQHSCKICVLKKKLEPAAG